MGLQPTPSENRQYNESSPSTAEERTWKITPQQQKFLDLLFENGGQVTAAAVDAGYSRGSAGWLRRHLADEIVERTKDVLSMNALKAANRLVSTMTTPPRNAAMICD